jgi:epidermal growth factor receptor substrate 15
LGPLDAEARNKYDFLFQQADKDMDGFINGKEAKEFFVVSKLPNSVLKIIWLGSYIW